MTVSIHELLGDLRSTALDERDKGDKFERLIKAFLKTDPEWSAKFSDVWLWSEWDGRGNVPDVGIDLVAKHSDRDGFAAIQAKFYTAARVPDLDKIVGMRNIIAHEYGDIDYEIVWRAATTGIPAVIPVLNELVDDARDVMGL